MRASAHQPPDRRCRGLSPRRPLGVVTLLLSCAYLLVVPYAPAQQRELTVERLYSEPSLSGPTLRGPAWSPDGHLLSYMDQRGNAGDELWAVEAATGQRRVLVEAERLRSMLLEAASRGQQTGLGRLTAARYLWAPDSQALLFISAEDLFWYDLRTRTSKHLVGPPVGASSEDDWTIEDPKISPNGRWVSFVRGYDVWTVNVEDGEVRRLTPGGTEDVLNGKLDWVYPEELEITSAYWWSPDSLKIAFLQLDQTSVNRYPVADMLSYQGAVTETRYPIAGSANPVARVGVVPVSGGEVQWIDTGSDPSVLLARVDWHGDSIHLAIQRLTRVQDRLDLLFANADTGGCQLILTEQDPHWINLSNDFRYFDRGRRFLWSSERSGFRHLYVYDRSGRQLAQLTDGDWEVTAVEQLDEEDGFVYFTSTQQSSRERHLYRVPLSGGTPEQLTRDPGNHNANLAPDGAFFLDTYSNAMHPSRQDLYRADGTLVMTLAGNPVPELDTYGLQPVEFLTVPAADGTPLSAQLIKPPDFDPSRRYPVVVYLYGGPHVQVVRDAWQGTNFLFNQLLAQEGFLVFSLDNRGAAGYGHQFEAPIHRRFGQIELDDQLAGVAWLRRQPYVDGERIGIWGWSYGGYMTCLALFRAGDVFKAGFAGAPVTDWRFYDTIYTERYMDTPEDNPEGYRDSSPVNYAAGLRGTLLIAHATGDDNVHFANTMALQERLVEAGKYAELLLFPDRGHPISDPPARIYIFNRVVEMFRETLGSPPAAPGSSN